MKKFSLHHFKYLTTRMFSIAKKGKVTAFGFKKRASVSGK